LLAQASRLSVATDARVLYYTWARASMQAEVAKRALVQAQAHLKDVQTAHATGSASKADVLAVESQVASAELGVTRASAAVELYDRQLHVLLHDRNPAPYRLGEDLRVDPSGTGTGRARDEQALVERAQRTRLEPQALRHGSGALREQASTALAAELPRLSAVGSVLYAQPNPRIFPQKERWDATCEAGVRLSWTPTEIFGAEAGREVNLAKARQLDEERAQLEDGIALEVKQQLLALAESEAALVSARRQVGAAEESYRVRRALFQNGRATSAELTDAENEWSRAQLELIGARIDRRIAEARLIHALGEDVELASGR
jgi:outer membrane protein TolC